MEENIINMIEKLGVTIEEKGGYAYEVLVQGEFISSLIGVIIGALLLIAFVFTLKKAVYYGEDDSYNEDLEITFGIISIICFIVSLVAILTNIFRVIAPEYYVLKSLLQSAMN